MQAADVEARGLNPTCSFCWKMLNHMKFFRHLYLKLKSCLKLYCKNLEGCHSDISSETSKKDTNTFILASFQPCINVFLLWFLCSDLTRPQTLHCDNKLFYFFYKKHEHEAFIFNIVVFLKQLCLKSDRDRVLWVPDCSLNKTTYLIKITFLTFNLQNN